MPRPSSKDVYCQVCGAEPGQQCRRLDGSGPRRSVHQERVWSWRASRREPGWPQAIGAGVREAPE